MLAPSMALSDTVPSFQSSIKTCHNEAWLEKKISTRHSAEEKREQLCSPRTVHTLWVLQNPFKSHQSNSGSTGPSVGTVLTFPSRLDLKGKQHSQPVSRVYFSLSETKFLVPMGTVDCAEQIRLDCCRRQGGPPEWPHQTAGPKLISSLLIDVWGNAHRHEFLVWKAGQWFEHV